MTDTLITPGYLKLLASGELDRRVESLMSRYRKCNLCPHECGVDRTHGERGICQADAESRVASANIHHGEEPPISGTDGSGTIFFSHCSGRCLFCQNYPISQQGTGNRASTSELGRMMLNLQSRGCHNINFVTPTHVVPSMAAAILYAARNGLTIPIVYNSSGYDSAPVIRELSGIIDIYLPDAKYADDATAKRISGFSDYVRYNRAAIREMYNQVGVLEVSNGTAARGLLVRHLILPDGLSGTASVMDFLADHISHDVPVSLMDQYFPAHLALGDSVLSRRITHSEYDDALQAFHDAGLNTGYIQDHFEE